MLPRVDMNGPRPPAAVDSPAAPVPVAPVKPAERVAGASTETHARLAQLVMGKEFQASLVSRLSDGSFLVRLANAASGAASDATSGLTMRMNLPAGMQAGDPIRLTLVALDPRPTFLLGSARGDGSAQAALSDAGRLIDHFLQSARQQGMPAALLGKTPLVASSAIAAAPLAAALQDALDTSGLFYESHMAQWAAGQRPLASMLSEPQARLAMLSPATTAWPPQSSPSSATQSYAVADASDSLGLLSSDPAFGDMAAAHMADALPPSAAHDHPELTRLVSLQLNALEQRGMAWHGEVWPGQFMEWDIDEESPQNASQEESVAERAWQSVVRFDLPALGTVAASLRLSGGHLQVQLRTASEHSAATLRAHAPKLGDALAAAGSALDLLTVRQDDSI